MSEQDHYRVLDLPRTASALDIKRRYRALMRRAHPDANNGSAAATRRAAGINLAYETLGDARRRREYDERSAGSSRASTTRGEPVYARWAQQPDWEDIVAEHVPPRRPAHKHAAEPYFDPDEIVVTTAELRASPRVRRRVRFTNPCECTLRGAVSTTEPWVWGPIGRFQVGPAESIEFDVEVIARKVQFPGVSRVQFCTDNWTGTLGVNVAGYEPKTRRRPPAADMAYVRGRARRRWARAR